MGNRACAIEKFKKDVREIKKDPYSFWIGIGDMADFISPKDPRFDASCIDDKMLKASEMGSMGYQLIRQVRDIVKPVAHKCLGMGTGNHEYRYMREQDQQQLHHWLCTSLQVPDLEYSSFMDLSFVKIKGRGKPELKPISWSRFKASKTHNLSNVQTFRLFTHHGAGSANTPGGKLNRLKQFMNGFDADIYAIAHVHGQTVLVDTTIAADATCKNLVDKVKIGIITGAYFRTYNQGATTYAEIKGYMPSTLGAVQLTIQPARRRVSTSLGGEL